MRSLIFLLLGAAVLVGLFYAMPRDLGQAEPTTVEPAPPPAEPTAPAAQAKQAPPETKSESPPVLRWEYRDGRVTAAPPRPQVRRGQQLRIEVLSDVPEEVHLHGYDRTLALTPGEPAVLELEAVHSGRFELELHGSHTALGVLIVTP